MSRTPASDLDPSNDDHWNLHQVGLGVRISCGDVFRRRHPETGEWVLTRATYSFTVTPFNGPIFKPALGLVSDPTRRTT